MISVWRPKRFRALDWTLAGFTLGMGIILLVPGDSLAASPAGAALLRRAPEFLWGFGISLIGIARIMGLIINGRLPHGSPILRGTGALLAAVTWSQFFASAVEYSLHSGSPSPDVAYTLALMVGEIGLCVRATFDYVRANGHGCR